MLRIEFLNLLGVRVVYSLPYPIQSICSLEVSSAAFRAAYLKALTSLRNGSLSVGHSDRLTSTRWQRDMPKQLFLRILHMMKKACQVALFLLVCKLVCLQYCLQACTSLDFVQTTFINQLSGRAALNGGGGG